MNVMKTDVDLSEIDHQTGWVSGNVTFFFELPDEHAGGTAHFQCKARLDQSSSNKEALKALVREAGRQVSRMPEYLMGERRLTFAKGTLAQ